MVLSGITLAGLGAFLATALAAFGGAIGIGYSGTAMISAIKDKPETFSKGMISVVLSEALAIYGLLSAFMIVMRMSQALTFHDGIFAIASGLAIGLASIGAGIGISHAGSALCWSLKSRPEAFSKSLVSVVLAEALSIYGLLVSFMIIMKVGTLVPDPGSVVPVAVQMAAFTNEALISLMAALTVGLGGLFAGLAIGWGGSAMTGSVEARPETFSKAMVSVVLAEALAIYTLLVAFMLLMG